MKSKPSQPNLNPNQFGLPRHLQFLSNKPNVLRGFRLSEGIKILTPRIGATKPLDKKTHYCKSNPRKTFKPEFMSKSIVTFLKGVKVFYVKHSTHPLVLSHVNVSKHALAHTRIQSCRHCLHSPTCTLQRQ